MGRSLLIILLMAGGLFLTAAVAMAALADLRGSHVTIPEPATMLLFGTGLIALASFTRKVFPRN